MKNTTLESTLRSAVRRYGFREVYRCLQKIGTSDGQDNHSQPGLPSGDGVALPPSASRPRNTAPEYVAKLEIAPENKPAVVELAVRFHNKTFLPTFGDIAIFCQNYGIAEPSSKSRANAIPRVFKYLSGMDAGQIQDILKYRMYSGPSELGPIADAIRRNGRAAAASRLEIE